MRIWDGDIYIKDVNSLKEIISDNQLKGDFSGLNALIESINRHEIVDYTLKQFSIHLNGAISGSYPKNKHFCKIDLENRLAVKDNLNDKIDPLFKYTLDLKISLFNSESDQNKVYCSTWHLDKEEKELDFSYIHPYYHIQFGGKKHEYLDPDMAVLSSPRIPHPPMDVILAFHFILNNFIDRKKKENKFVDTIKNDPRYMFIVNNSKKRLWDSYFNGFSSSYQHDEYKIKKLFPLYT